MPAEALAETDDESRVSANSLAESAMLNVLDLVDHNEARADDDPEGVDHPAAEEVAAAANEDGIGDDLDDGVDDELEDDSQESAEGYSASERQVFATETMASLLEGQGDLAGAMRVRASISGESEEVERRPRYLRSRFRDLGTVLGPNKYLPRFNTK